MVHVMSEERKASDTQSETSEVTNRQGTQPLAGDISDEDLEAEIKILEEQIPMSDDDKFRKKDKKQDEIFEEGADDVKELSEEQLEKDYGI